MGRGHKSETCSFLLLFFLIAGSRNLFWRRAIDAETAAWLCQQHKYKETCPLELGKDAAWIRPPSQRAAYSCATSRSEGARWVPWKMGAKKDKLQKKKKKEKKTSIFSWFEVAAAKLQGDLQVLTFHSWHHHKLPPPHHTPTPHPLGLATMTKPLSDQALFVVIAFINTETLHFLLKIFSIKAPGEGIKWTVWGCLSSLTSAGPQNELFN